METIRFNNNWNKVNTKDELKELLNRYKKILSNYTLNYLNSLIELEYVIRRLWLNK